MVRLRFRIAMSLDGYTAGPRQSVENPLGIGGTRLHEWAYPLAAWRRPQGLKGGKVNQSTPVIEELLANVGATIMGRNMFAGHPGPWDTNDPWNGWWGANPPFHHPVFVLTHPPAAEAGGRHDLHLRHRWHPLGLRPGAPSPASTSPPVW